MSKSKSSTIYQCKQCGAMVFVLEKLHDVICKDYQNDPSLVKTTHEFYAKNLVEFKEEEAVEKKKTRRKK
jgi:hypothetical protein